MKATCIDIDPEALVLGRRLAEAMGIADRIVYKRGNAKKVDEYEEDNKYHIVMTQGFLDYLTAENSVEFLKKVNKITRPGGSVVVSNMDTHRWIRFWMEIFGNWRLDYKNGDKIKSILKNSGYIDVEVFHEPKKLHYIGIGIKP